MNQSSHGGPRPGAGRKPNPAQRVKRTVTLAAAADGVVLAQQQPGESYSATLERVLLAAARPPARTPLDALVELLTPERQPVRLLYRQLGWTRQVFAGLIGRELPQLAERGVRLHVATHEASAGRLDRYITIDGMRYGAVSRERD